MKIIDVLSTSIFVILLISFVIFIVFIAGINMSGRDEGEAEETGNFLLRFKIFRIGIPVFFVTLFVFIVFVNAHSMIGGNEVRSKIEWMSDQDYTLIINNTVYPKNDSLINDLQKIKSNTGNRPTGSDEIKIVLIYKTDTIPLHVIRDSDRQTKYWVYYDSYETSSNNDIGEINTSSLSRYK